MSHAPRRAQPAFRARRWSRSAPAARDPAGGGRRALHRRRRGQRARRAGGAACASSASRTGPTAASSCSTRSGSGCVDTVAPGTNGFLRGTMRGLARERKRQGVGPELPFRMIGRADGKLTLEDPGTGRRVDLGSFGPTNAAVFAQLMATALRACHGALTTPPATTGHHMTRRTKPGQHATDAANAASTSRPTPRCRTRC